MFNYLKIISICLLTIVITPKSVTNISAEDKQVKSQSLVSREDLPHLGTEYNNSFIFKATSRKNVYHIGEMLTIDVALLNNSDNQVYIRKPKCLDISVSNFAGKNINLMRYFIIDPMMDSPRDYEILQPGEFTNGAIQILLGCDKRAFLSKSELASIDERVLFNNNRFVSWGEACLDIKSSGKYSFIFNEGNQSVVVSSGQNKDNPKTVVGKIQSKPYTITVIR